MLRTLTFAILALTCCIASAAADKVLLFDGRSFEGVIVENTEDHVVIKTKFAKMKFAKSTVKKITKGQTKEQLFAEKKTKLDKADIEAHMKLIEWCLSNSLDGQAREVAQMVAKLDKDHAEAREILGHVKHEGVWMTRTELARKMKAKQGGAPPVGNETDSFRVRTRFSSEQDKAKYVSELFKKGKARFLDSDISGARRYWNAIMKHFPEAEDHIFMIKGHLGIKTEPQAGGSGQDGDESGAQDTGRSPKRRQGGYGSMYGTRPGQRQNKPTPPKAKPRKTTDPDDDFGGGEGKGEDSAGNKVKKPRKGGGGDFDGGEGKKEEKTRKDPPKKPAKKPAKKPVKKPVRAKGPHPMARFFRIERVAIAGNLTNAGTYPEVQLQFKAFKRVKFITVIWYCMTKKGHIFWAVHTFFGPDLNKVHRKVAALTPKQETKFGRITAGRVEIYYGSYKDRELLAVGKTGKVLKQFIGKTWWEPEEDYEGQMILYAPKTHPFETNTLKRYRSKH